MSGTHPLAIIIVAAIGLSACVSEMVERRSPRKGPVPEVGFVDPGGGEVRYSVEGWSLIVAGRRRAARRRMRKVCRGLKVRVLDEFTREDVDVGYSQDDLVPNIEKGLPHYDVSPHHHVVFECVSAGGAARP